jgi:hypothetical protein
MITFFNMQNIEKQSKGNPVNLVLLVGHVAGLKKPNFFKGTAKDLVGYSFLTNAVPLCANLQLHDPEYVVQYIKLAALRDYAFYKRYGVTYLDTSFYPDLATANITANPLITINKNQIYFKYEEIYNGIKLQRHQG